MTLSEAKTSLALKLDIRYSDIATNSLWTDAELSILINIGCRRAWDYKPWTFKNDTYTFTSLGSAYYGYPNDFEDGSISRVAVGGDEYRKLTFEDYQQALENDPDTDENIWCEHRRNIFIHNCSTGSTVDVTGVLRFTELSSASDKLPFSFSTEESESSGNFAIVTLAYAEALGSQKMKNPNQAVIEEARGLKMLDKVWEPIGQRRANESPSRPIWEVPNFFS